MKDYFRYYGETMAKRWFVFWGESINIISPFDNWSKTGNYKNGNDSNELSWWTAYTELKHDRLSNRKKATLANSVKSVGALLLAIIKCEYLREEIEHAGWITGFAQRPIGWLGEDSNDTHKAYVAIETKLFGYAVGWFDKEIKKKDCWGGPASSRFISWFDEYHKS